MEKARKWFAPRHFDDATQKELDFLTYFVSKTRELFKLAIDRKPAIVFVDEIDAVLTRRGEQEHDSLRRVKTEFFIWMSRIADVC